MEVNIPTGTVTFLFTDIEGSTRLWEQYPEAMKTALRRHDEILRGSIEAQRGHVIKTTGDGVHAAFGTALDGVAAALKAQQALLSTKWDEIEPHHVKVRIGIHTGKRKRARRLRRPALNRGGATDVGRARRADAALHHHRRSGARPTAARSRGARPGRASPERPGAFGTHLSIDTSRFACGFSAA